MKTLIGKRKSHAFGKDVYLLGQDDQGTLYWLESPKFDCGGYWGFGYVETYTNNKRPDLAKGVSCHQHIDSTFLGQHYKYDFETKEYKKLEFVNNLFDSSLLKSPTFTESEGWQLSELFKQFYLLQDMAAFSHKTLPGCHITTSLVNHGDLKGWNEKINKVMIPAITAKIIEILTSKK